MSHDAELFRRETMCKPGSLVYCAKMDQEKLEKLYCCQFLCPVKKVMASRTFVDVYTNGLLTNVPAGCACCFWLDKTNFLLWDDKRIGSLGKAGCCKPFPWLCPHCCGCCGEALYMNKAFGCCLQGCPTFAGHCSMVIYCIVCGLCATDVILGLKEGEGVELEQNIEKARRGDAVPLAPAMPPMVQAMGAVAGV
eukprot:TRINITY_DN2634_c0_g1_i6.p1 TRINITY_DN2634_c0_g1~~TRINITY_DN2634_c0_g1_i6.p1  ORF type:complete len:194 (+),score=33.37 TRINITY_DN2634_c0_g1_i6:64-645(+)